jgi:hypothetical protein
MFPVRYGLYSYMLFRRNSVFKGLTVTSVLQSFVRGFCLVPCEFCRSTKTIAETWFCVHKKGKVVPVLN